MVALPLCNPFTYEKRNLLETDNFSVNELLKIKEELTKERDDQLGDIVKLREQLAQSAATQQHLEEQKQQCEEKIQEVQLNLS